VDFKTTAIRHPSASKSARIRPVPGSLAHDPPRVTGSVTRFATEARKCPAAACRQWPFIETFHVPTVGASLANYDDDRHTDN
jgi:hypothetical protein